MWSNGLIGQSITFAIGMKISQYFKIPPQEAFVALIWGTVLGGESSFQVIHSRLSLTIFTGIIVQNCMFLCCLSLFNLKVLSCNSIHYFSEDCSP